jgi:nucleoside 2-deoxyribosyltransferase
MDTINQCAICQQAVHESYYLPNPKDVGFVKCERCGPYHISGNLSRSIGHVQIKDFHIYSGAIRELNERLSEPPLVDDLDRLLSQVKVPKDPIEMMDRIVLSLKTKAQRADTVIPIIRDDYPIGYSHDFDEFQFLLVQMHDLGYVHYYSGTEVRIKTGGWRRLTELEKELPQRNQAFVAMSFHESLDPLWKNSIEPALSETNYDPFRVDRREHNEKIDDYIVAEIRRSGLLVADFTGQRNGVYFEAGFALGLGIPVIWCCKESEKEQLHFDTRQYNHILWKTPEDLKTQLINRINATAPAPKKFS